MVLLARPAHPDVYDLEGFVLLAASMLAVFLEQTSLKSFGDYEGYVVVLLARAELVDFVDYGGEQVVGRKGAVAAECGGETLFAEFIAGFVEGLGDAVGVKRENVASRKLDFADFAVPVLKRTDNRGGGFEARKRIVAAQQQRGKVAAVGVTQPTGGVVVFSEKQCGERTVGRVVAKKLVHGAQHALRLVHGDGALAPKIGLEVGHQQCRGDSLAGNVANDEPQPLAA